MFKRLLAFVLAGALIFETPATTFAAEQIPVTEQDSTDGLEETSDDTEPAQEEVVEESEDSDTTEKNEAGGVMSRPIMMYYLMPRWWMSLKPMSWKLRNQKLRNQKLRNQKLILLLQMIRKQVLHLANQQKPAIEM